MKTLKALKFLPSMPSVKDITVCFIFSVGGDKTIDEVLTLASKFTNIAHYENTPIQIY